MEQYWDCSLCRIEDKGRAFRCRSCRGRLTGRERLLHEIGRTRKARRWAAWMSALAAGLGQMFLRRWSTGLVFAALLPLALGLAAATWKGFTYGHAFIAVAAVFVLAVGAADALLGVRETVAPCQATCPASLAIPDYLQLIVDGEWRQGYELIQTRIPLVGVIGRVCPHPCEARCVRGIDGEPIAINGCKRFLADRHREQEKQRDAESVQRVVHVDGGALRVGIVGSGPAGLACAYYLNVLGVTVTVYEADPVLGGRLATTIPDYRLPPYILDEELESLKDRGVAFAVDSPVGPGGTPVADLLRDHDALFLAVGAADSLPLPLPGAEAFTDFQAFLRAARFRKPVPVGERVAVIGGGNAAIDVCRSALRLGAEEVHLLYRRGRDEMPARDDEVEEAGREGVRFHFLADPAEARLDGGRLRELVVRKMRLGAADASGRPRPEPVAGEDWVLPVDTVIPALGQRVSGDLFGDPSLAGLRRHPDGRVWADPATQRTSLARVYAGGDAVVGPATAVEAMAQGRRAALAIFGDLAPNQVPASRLADRRLRKPFPSHRETAQAKIREEMPRLSLRHRRAGFREVEEGFREPSACREAGRCLQCHREL